MPLWVSSAFGLRLCLQLEGAQPCSWKAADHPMRFEIGGGGGCTGEVCSISLLVTAQSTSPTGGWWRALHGTQCLRKPSSPNLSLTVKETESWRREIPGQVVQQGGSDIGAESLSSRGNAAPVANGPFKGSTDSRGERFAKWSSQALQLGGIPWGPPPCAFLGPAE